MGHKFADIAFTEQVKQLQQQCGSREGYASWENSDDFNHRLGDKESRYLSRADSFYMASVSETDWPYVQHRGGPAGFIKVLDDTTLGFADYVGNRQFVSSGNFQSNDRVALIIMDYANRRRLKILGHIKAVADDDKTLLARLATTGQPDKTERGFIITVAAFDWNCPKYIPSKNNDSELESLRQENQALKAQLAQLQTADSPPRR